MTLKRIRRLQKSFVRGFEHEESDMWLREQSRLAVGIKLNVDPSVDTLEKSLARVQVCEREEHDHVDDENDVEMEM